MDYSALSLTLVFSLISCAAAVVSWLNARKPMSVEIQSTVDELVTLVEKMMKENRKVKMTNVRAAAKDTGDTPINPVGTPGGLPSVGQSKQELRALMRQKAMV